MHSSQQQINGPTNHDTLPIHANTLPALGGASYLRTGRILAGRYRLERVLGYGAMGEVYRAMDLQQQDLCAVKLVLPGASLSLQAHQRLQQESKVIARLYHPNIVEVRDYGDEPDGTHFLVMELLEGTDLRTLLATDKRLTWQEARRIAHSVGAALQYAHQMGVVHRDVNPNNIFLCSSLSPDGTAQEVVKVLDFGLAKFFDGGQGSGESVQLTKGMVIGTPAYVPPEAGGAYGGLMGPGRDQWSLAVVLYRMLAGRLPFERSNVFQLYQSICHEAPPPLQEQAPGLPAHVYAAIHRALSKEPAARFATIKDFLRALEGLPPLGGNSLLSGITALKADPEPTPPNAGSGAGAAVTAPGAQFSSDADEDSLPPHEPLKTVRISAEELALLAGKSRSDTDAAPVAAQPEVPTSPHRYTQTLMSQAVPPPEESAISVATPLSMSQLSWLGTEEDHAPTLRDATNPLLLGDEEPTTPPSVQPLRPTRLPGMVESSPRRPPARVTLVDQPAVATAAPNPVIDIGSRPTHLAVRDETQAPPSPGEQNVPAPLADSAAPSPAAEPRRRDWLLTQVREQTTRIISVLQNLPTRQAVTTRSLVVALCACLVLGVLLTKLWFATHAHRTPDARAIESIYLTQYQPPARVIPSERKPPRTTSNRGNGTGQQTFGAQPAVRQTSGPVARPQPLFRTFRPMR
jgi:serine/threonine protein kinase